MQIFVDIFQPSKFLWKFCQQSIFFKDIYQQSEFLLNFYEEEIIDNICKKKNCGNFQHIYFFLSFKRIIFVCENFIRVTPLVQTWDMEKKTVS